MQNFLDNLDVPPIIPVPKEGRARTLILCFDGTGDQFDEVCLSASSIPLSILTTSPGCKQLSLLHPARSLTPTLELKRRSILQAPEERQ